MTPESILEKQYWKSQKKSDYLWYAGIAVEIIGFILTLLVAFETKSIVANPEVTEADILVVLNMLTLATIPIWIGNITQLLSSFTALKLKCAACKHPLRQHKNSKGETFSHCKHWRLNKTFSGIDHCQCKEFVLAE